MKKLNGRYSFHKVFFFFFFNRCCIPWWVLACFTISFHNLLSLHFSLQFLNFNFFNPLNAELNPIYYLLALLGAHHFLHFSRIRVKSLTLMQLMSYTYIYTYIYIYIYIYIYMEHLFLMFLEHTQRRSTVGRTPLDE